MKEIWKDISDYEGLYEVSSLGRVRRNNTLLKPRINSCGYAYVALNKSGYIKQKAIHRLVAETFISNTHCKPQVNHIDENKTNNIVSNLEWVTAKENMNHGTVKYRCTAHIKKPLVLVDIVTGEKNTYDSISAAARSTGLQASGISRCLSGKLKHSGNYSAYWGL